MADPQWDDTLPIAGPQAAAPDEPRWEETQPVEATPASATSPVTAATTGLANGASLNFAPAISSFGKTALDAVSGVNGPLAGGSLDDLVDEYRRNRDQLKADFAKAAAAHPAIAAGGNIVGGVAALSMPAAASGGLPAIPGLGSAAATPGGMAALGGMQGLGASNADLTKGELGQAAKDAVTGAATNVAAGTVINAAAPAVAGAVKAGAQKVSGALGGLAEKLAVKATGANGSDLSKFADDTGRELLNRKIVKFGSSPGDIAANAQTAIDAAEQSKTDAINGSGAKVDLNTVYNYIRAKIQALQGNPSQAGLVRNLEGKLEDIAAAAEQTGSEVPLQESEAARRGFDEGAKWESSTDAPAREANKVAANAYRETGENAATAANPELGAQFQDAKDTQSLLIPVQKAAAKRAGVIQQSPQGGLLDMAAAGAGYTMAGKVGALAGLAIKSARTRFASAEAVATNFGAKQIARMGKYAPALQSAAARGGTSLAATDYILQQQDPDYREHRKKALDEPEADPAERVLASGEESVK